MTATELPRWDVANYYPGIESREFTSAEEQLGSEIDRLVALYDRHNIRGGSHQLSDETAASLDEVLTETNRVAGELEQLFAYAYTFVSTDSTNTAAQAAMSRVQQASVAVDNLSSRLDAWFAALGSDALVELNDTAKAHAWLITKGSRRAEYQMPEGEEELASLMGLTGSSAWYQLYNDVTSSMSASVDMPDGPQDLPIFAVRGLATNSDPLVRKAAYDAELAAWQANAIPIAASLNAIKGEQQNLAKRRNWSHILDAQLFGQAVSRQTLDAMQGAMLDMFPTMRRYLKAKAGLLGHDNGLPFWSLFAPVGAERPVTWDEAKATVGSAFSSYSPQLRGLADRAFDGGWIDVAPRSGKSGGAFCLPMGDGDSRVLLNFNDSMNEVFTLAHELGHAYHNSTMTERSPLQRGTPSSLAETASIFCETILIEHGLRAVEDPQQKLHLLDVDLQGSAQLILDIHSRFLFESSVFAERSTSSLSIDRFNELMTEAQIATYGDGLDPEQRHPWMWAAKPHYYGSLFYNWPYTFGFLFGLGLYANYQTDPDRFRSGYDDLLSSTGLADATSLAARFDINVEDPAFWEASLQVVSNRVDEFCEIADV